MSAEAYVTFQRKHALVCLQNDVGETLLHVAADGGNMATLSLLLTLGASVHSVEPQGGCTPLHYAVRGGHAEAVTALLAAGADPTVQDIDGHSVHEMASDPRVVEALRPKV